MRRVIVEMAESSEKTSADQSSTPQVFRVTVETGIIQFSSVAGNSKSGAVRSARSYSESGQHTDRILDTQQGLLSNSGGEAGNSKTCLKSGLPQSTVDGTHL